ncbi:hypothetical protein Hbl1158_03985 [Halobaculum sp. CBA1158]|uniref:hypothetical protein n=1 Tax=Halobaculum sp. CBA1158 TaxID=2904243 RepID=UPI001F464606|nr:hypothetical protein [Halobaculum sp. CBA1158]UIP00530.1 hypothetical protein Hbl1158_03985 [Halobaculum sp. CBA1158]
MRRHPVSVLVQVALWTATAVGVQVILGVSWGDPTAVFTPGALARSALLGGCVAGGGLLAAALPVRGREVVGALAATLLVTLLATTLFGASVAGPNGALSLVAGYGTFVAMAYAAGWAVDGVVRRGVVVEDGVATFDGPR